jgi:hypothetical protein
MQELTFDQLLEAASTLAPEQRQVLAQILHVATVAPQVNDSFADSDVLNEAGAFSVFTPLHDTQPHQPIISDEELMAASQCISCEWEEDPL